MTQLTEDELYEVFNYLDELRASGSVNMFGASANVKSDFGYDSRLARSATLAWMSTYDPEKELSDRVREGMTQL